MKTRKLTSVFIGLLCFAAVAVELSFAGSDSSGSLIVGNQGPVIGLGSLWDSADANDVNNTLLSVWTEYHVNFTLTDNNTLYDLSSSYVTVWDATGGQGDADANATHLTFEYSNTTDAWSEIGPGPSNAHLISGNCVKPSNRSEATGTYGLAWKLDYVANYTSSAKSWKIEVNVTDSATNSATNGTIIFGINFYSSNVVVDTTHAWSGANPGDTNKTLTTPSYGYINVTVTANGVWHLEGKGSAALNDGAGHTIALANIMMHHDTLANAAALTDAFVDIVGLTSQVAGANIEVYVTLWATVPGGQVSGTYTYTFSVQIGQG